MRYSKSTIEASSVGHATDMAVLMGKNVIKRAEDFQKDVKKKQRLVKGECRACFYLGSKIGGQTMTTSFCGLCDEEIMNGSTCVDRVCRPCGEAHELCVYCGGDLKMRVDRVFKNKNKG